RTLVDFRGANHRLILRSEAKPRVSKDPPEGRAGSVRTGASFEAAPRRLRTRGRLRSCGR
ncbi:MAG TPA: hypothetical protein VGG86_04995, partial [Roseiarcus sp.]